MPTSDSPTCPDASLPYDDLPGFQSGGKLDAGNSICLTLPGGVDGTPSGTFVLCIRKQGETPGRTNPSDGKLQTVRIALPSPLDATFGALVTLSASAADTVGELKERLAAIIGVGAAEQLLSFNGTALSIDSASMGSAGVTDGATIDLALSGAAPATPYVVKVALPPSLQAEFGETLSIATSPTATVDSLKATLESVLGAGAAQQTLHFGGAQLQDGGATLASAGIATGDMVMLSVPSRGEVSTVVIALPADLNATFGSSITLEASASDTVGELKAQLAAIVGVSAAQQLLSFGGASLSADGASLGSVGVTDGSTIDLALSGAAPATPYVVTVALPPSLQAEFGETLSIATDPSATVDSLKATLESVLGAGAAQQTLHFGGAQLQDGGATLASAGIATGDMVMLSVPSRGEVSTVVIVLPASLQAAFGSSITLEASASDTVGELKAQLAAIVGVGSAQQLLSFGGASLSADGASLGSVGVTDGATIDLALSGAAPATPYVVTVALPPSLQAEFGESLSIATDPSATVDSLKATLESVLGAGVAQQTLHFGGAQLENGGATLASAGIATGDTVLLGLPLPGEVSTVVIALPASLQATFGASITLEASASDTVGELKAQLASIVGVSAAQQLLSFGGASLSADGASLGSTGVTDGSTIDLALSGAAPATPYVVTVALPPSLQAEFGETLSIATSPTATVDSLKATLESVLGAGAAQQTLHFGGAQLQDGGATLASAGIATGDTVLLGVPSRGEVSTVVIALPADLNATFGSSITLEASASDTVGELKAQLAAIVGVSAAQQLLSFGGASLSADGASLGSVGVTDGSTIDLALSGAAPATPYVVTVALPPSLQAEFGETLSIATSPTATVDSLKATLESVLGAGAAQQTLHFGGAQLENGGATLASAGIATGAMVMLSVPSRGEVSTVVIALPASLQSTFGASITLEASASDTVGELKAQLAAIVGVGAAQQLLSFGGASLSADGASLGSVGVTDGSTIDLALSGAAPATPYVVTVALPPSLQAEFGETLSIATDPSATVDSLKATLESVLGAGAAQQTLHFGGAQLANGAATLSSAGIATGDTLLLDVPSHGEVSTVVIALPPSLHSTFGSTLTISARASTTVDDVKSLINSALGTPVADQLLSVAGTAITGAGTATLGSLAIGNGDVISLALSATPAASSFVVTIALPAALQSQHGTSLSLATSAGTTVNAFKGVLENLLGVGALNFELVFSAAALTNGAATLGSSGVTNGATMELMLPGMSTETVTVRLPAALHSAFGQEITLAANGSSTVAQVKAALESLLGVPAAQHLLSFNGSALTTSGATLGSVGISSGGVIDLAVAGVLPNTPYIVTVALPASLQATFGEALSIATDPSATVDSLKATLESVLGAGAAQQTLHFGGAQLENGGATLASAGIATGDTVLLGLPLPGEVSTVVIALPASLQATFGASITLEASASDTVGELKAQLASIVGVGAAQQLLSFGGASLSADGASLGSVGVTDGSTIDLALSGAAPATPYVVTVALPPSLQAEFGETLSIATSPTATVDSLKATLESVLGAGAAQQTLHFGGAQLENGGATLASAGIATGDMVMLSVPSRGEVSTVVIALPASLQASLWLIHHAGGQRIGHGGRAEGAARGDCGCGCCTAAAELWWRVAERRRR